MKICRLSRPPVQNLFSQFPQTRDYLLKKMEKSGHEFQDFPIEPVKIPNRYLSYGLGIPSALFRFQKMKPDVILADNIEAGMVALLIKFLFKTPFVFNFLDDYSLIASYDRWKLRYWGARVFERIIPKYADLVITVDSVKKGYCLQHGLPESKVRLIPNGADIARFKPMKADEPLRKRWGLKGDKVVLFVGKLNRYYRVETVLQAAPLVLTHCPETKFLLVGDGDAVGDLKALSKHLGIEQAVLFTGFQPPDEIPKIINLSDLCFFPLPDSSALAIFEYMACAKPVVLPGGGTPKMGISRDMIPEDCAVHVENSPDGFSRGILFLLNHPDAAGQIGQTGRERVTRLFEWNALADTYRKVLEDFSLIKENLPPKQK
jgi:glycosyltransferase involved in cell wall biosynthesis